MHVGYTRDSDGELKRGSIGAQLLLILLLLLLLLLLYYYYYDYDYDY